MPGSNQGRSESGNPKEQNRLSHKGALTLRTTTDSDGAMEVSNLAQIVYAPTEAS